ncbi:MAG: FKBP-type peptidyl-prolyl cis-trans isomerase [Tannerella sp.]|jgi:peptidylprolyl isomerase/FKBP-type peptidyl-prolyl cis-trans isomerase FklB|nr:FKBP-type peptidyl-prolyl cis-trans isomerase [Tannerella sp.]
MKKIQQFNPARPQHLFLYIICIVLLAACNKDDASTDDAWRTANEQAFNALAHNTEYTEIKAPSNGGSIYYKSLQKGEGTKPIYYTSYVQVYYKGWYVVTDAEKGITAGDVFDQRLSDTSTPLAVSVNPANSETSGASSVIEGWQVALQHMVEGDKWEIWIPSELSYGSTASGTMPGYTTLAFEIEVVKVYGVEE